MITTNDNQTIGNTVCIRFMSLGDKDITGKVDTGATTSSMHATNIQQSGNQISFICPYISDRAITMDLDGSQDVASADGGNNKRPMIKLDISVDGVELPGISFNLNDRSEMDCPILIGQNIIKSGNFIIDLNKDDNGNELPVGESVIIEDKEESKRENNIMDAIKILKDNKVTIFDRIFTYCTIIHTKW
jgi:hypothetical protein